MVAGGAGGGVAGEVLQGGDHPGALQAAHVGARRAWRRGRGLRPWSPRPGPTGSRARRRRPATGPGARRPRPCHGRSRRPSVDEVGVEGGGPGDRGGVDGGAVGGEAGEALLVDDRRDAEARAVDHRALLAHQLGGALGGGERAAAVDAGEVAEPVPARLGERRGGARGEHVLHRRDVLVGSASVRTDRRRCPPSGCRAGPTFSSSVISASSSSTRSATGRAWSRQGSTRASSETFRDQRSGRDRCRIEMNRQAIDAV